MMKPQEGLSHSEIKTVTEEMLAGIMLPGTPMVFSTPSLLLLIEETCYKALEPYYEDGDTSVGLTVEFAHTAPTPLSMEVRCEVRIDHVDRSIITFDVQAYDDNGIICKGTHKRAIVNRAKIEAKSASRFN